MLKFNKFYGDNENHQKLADVGTDVLFIVPHSQVVKLGYLKSTVMKNEQFGDWKVNEISVENEEHTHLAHGILFVEVEVDED